MHGTIEARASVSWRRGCFLGGMMLIAALAAPGAADASTYRWQADASGDWNVPGNWEVVDGPAGVGYPNLAADVAVFDEPLTAPRTVTIPDTLTVAIGRLTITLSPMPARLTIQGAGSGLLVLDNAGEDAVMESTGAGEPVLLNAPIELAADVNIDGRFNVSLGGGIGEAGGARNVTISGGSVGYSVANTYTGTTTVTNGSLSAIQDNVVVRMLGSLVVGDGAGAAGSASVSIAGDSIDHTADVLVRADGVIEFMRNSSLTSFAHTLDGLTVEGGQVFVSVTATTLTVQTLTMAGGDIRIASSGGGNSLRLLGALNATSTAAGQAVIRGASPVPGTFLLATGNHDFTVADGPQAVDFLIETTIGQIDPGAALSKQGAGLMRVDGNASYTGTTAILAGTLHVIGSQPASAVQVGATGTLSGSGTVGTITAAANSTVAPGHAVGPLNSGSVGFTADARLAIEITATGAGSDQLNVTGTVSLGNATLDVTSPFLLAPAATFTIINNDGSDAVTGTFQGLAEGAWLTLASGAVYQISYQGGDGNDVVLANVTPVTYFLSEGATGSFFDEDVLIANPNTVPALVTLTFFLQGGGTVVRQVTVPPQSRMTVEVDEIPGLEATSASVEVRSDNRLTLGVERTMFWDSTHYGGHTANSVPRAEQQWFFAEGAQGFFDTYLLLANPSGEQTATVTFLRENDVPFVINVPLATQSRTTIYAGDYPQLVGQAFGITVNAPMPITAERAMYFATTPARLWSGGHDNVGSPEAATSWFHPEGASGTFFNTFILMSNPQNQPATVTLRFLLQGGSPIELPKTIPAQARLTVNPAAEGIVELQNASFSTVVTSDVPIVSERAMYWNTDDTLFGEGHASSGLTATALDWTLAEGRVGGANAYTTYILLANPQSTAAAVKVTYLREGVAPVVKTYDVPANSRFNIDVGGMVTELQNESFGALIEVTNNVAIAVERSMYWNVDGRFWSGGTNAVGAVVPR